MNIQSSIANLVQSYRGELTRNVARNPGEKLNGLKTNLNNNIQQGANKLQGVVNDTIEKGAYQAKLQVEALEVKMSQRLHQAFLKAQSAHQSALQGQPKKAQSRLAVKFAERLSGQAVQRAAGKAAEKTDRMLNKYKNQINSSIQHHADNVRPFVNDCIQHSAESAIRKVDVLESKLAGELHRHFASRAM